MLPVIALADSNNGICGLLSSFATVAGEVAVTLVVIGFIITGILFLTTAGSPEKHKTAMSALKAAVIGTVIVIIASLAYGIVANTFGANGGANGCPDTSAAVAN